MSHDFLYVIGELRPGGSERQLYYLLKSIDRDRYRPAVVVWNFKETDVYVSKIRSLGVPLYSFESCSRTEKLRRFCRIVGKIQPEVVHSYSFHTNFAVFLGTHRTRAIAIGTVRSDFDFAKKDSGVLLGRISARWPRTHIFNSSVAAEGALASKSFFAPKKVWVVRNGVELDSFRCEPPSINARTTIVGVGSLFPIKRWDRLLRAARELKAKKFDFHVRLIGDGPLRESLQKETRALGLADCIEFVGYSEDVAKIMADSSFLVHTAEKEGCPNSVMEAMASGRAVVATDAGDVPLLVEDGKTGFVVHRSDETILVERMETLISNRNLCSEMGKAGRQRAEREFGLDHLVADTLSAYRRAGWEDSWTRNAA